MALAVPLSRFTPRVGGGSAFFVRRHRVIVKTGNIFIFILYAFCSGCGTVSSHVPTGVPDREVPFGLYNGVRWDYHYGGWYNLDYPFSFVGDTLFLPFDLASIPDDSRSYTNTPSSKTDRGARSP